MPGFLFLQDPKHPLPRESYDDKNIQKIEALRNEIQGRHVIAFFTTPEDLRGEVLQALEKHRAEIEERLEGEVVKPTKEAGQRDQKSDSIPSPPDMYSAPAYLPGYEFVGRRSELAELDAWAASSSPLMVVEAIGGMGKSALTWQWTTTRSREVIPDLAGIFWFSFYERGARLASCFQHALAYLSGQPLEKLRGRRAPDLAEEVLAELRRKPYLLVLDGLERVLVAYHRLDASQIRDDQVESDLRGCIDPADTEVLRRLLSCRPSRLLVSTRLFPRALENKSHRPLPGVTHKELRGLNRDDAATFMSQAEIFGDQEALLRFTAHFEHHPLVLGVVAGLINDYRRDPGNFDRWHADPEAGGKLKLTDLDLVQRRTHILHHAPAGLDPKVRQVLCRAAAFPGAVDYDTLAVINPFLPPRPKEVPEPPRPGDSADFELWELKRKLRQATEAEERKRFEAEIHERHAELEAAYRQKKAEHDAYLQALQQHLASTEYAEAIAAFDRSLRELEQRGLLQFDRAQRAYDLHPVVRGYALDLLEGEDRLHTFSTIVDHFQSRPPDRYEAVEDIAELENSLAIFRALVGAGKLDQAVDFYRGRFAQTLLFSCEAYAVVIELLTPLFQNGLNEPPALDAKRDQGYTTNGLAIALKKVGRVKMAIELATLSLRLDLEEQDPSYRHPHLSNYGTWLALEDHLAAAERSYSLALRLARTIEGPALTRAQADLMVTAIRGGRWGKAQQLAATVRQGEKPPRQMLLPGYIELSLCWMRLARGEIDASEIDEALRIAVEANSRGIIRRLHALRGEWELERGRPAKAAAAFGEAIVMAQKAGVPVGHLRARLALARARLGEIEAAAELLSERGDETEDWTLAEAWLALGDHDKAREHGLRGYEWAWADGPPHIRWWELERMKKLLAELGIEPPDLPPFDPAKVEPIPYEEEIVAFIEEREAEQRERERKQES